MNWGFWDVILCDSKCRYSVPYPTMYASEADNKDAKLFNCVQVLDELCVLINFVLFS